MPDWVVSEGQLGRFNDYGSGSGSIVHSGRGIGAAVVPLTVKRYRLNAEAAEEAAFQGLELEMAVFTARMRIYPGPKTGSRYRRTQHLWGSWGVTKRRGIEIEVYNTAFYAAFVYGNNEGAIQQDQHRETGWPNMFEEFQKIKPMVVRHAQANFDKWAARMGA